MLVVLALQSTVQRRECARLCVSGSVECRERGGNSSARHRAQRRHRRRHRELGEGAQGRHQQVPVVHSVSGA